MPQNNVPNDQDDAPDHNAEFGLMTFVKGGKAMSLDELKSDDSEYEAAAARQAQSMSEENEARQKMRDDGVY